MVNEVRYCEVCDRKREIMGVASSSFSAISLAWCRECLDQNAEALFVVDTVIGIPDDDMLPLLSIEELERDYGTSFLDYIKVFHEGTYITVREYHATRSAT